MLLRRPPAWLPLVLPSVIAGGALVGACAALAVTAAQPDAPAPAPRTSPSGSDDNVNDNDIDEARPIDPRLRDELLAAAVEFSDRPRPATPVPAVLALSPRAFAREVCRDPNVPCENVLAAYDAQRVRVLVRTDLDLSKVWERSFVVHEYVHWFQHQAQTDPNAEPGCFAYLAAEREAYTAQNRYLRHHQSGRRAGTMIKMLHCQGEKG